MSDLPEQQYLPPAPEFDKTGSDATAIIATAMPLLPRPPFIPGQGKAPKIRRGKPCNALPVHTGDWAVKLPWVSLNPEHARALGIEGGVVVSALEQWYKPDRKGKAKIDITDCTGVYWIARSHAEFVACTGMTKKQVETGINDAIKAGIIETRVMPFGRKKIRKLHLRIVAADGAATLKGPLVIGAKPPVLQYVVIGQSAPVRFGMGGKARRSAFQIHNTTGTTNATEKSFKPGNEKTVADNTQGDAQMPSGKKSQNQLCPDGVVEEKNPKIGKPKRAKKQICPKSIDASFDACMEVEKRYGGDHALAVCKKAGFIPSHWKMLPKDACEAILGIADDLAVAHPSYSWEDVVLGFNPLFRDGQEKLVVG